MAISLPAIERHTKLVLNIAMGKRNQQTTDGFVPYRSAITTILHDRCDYAMLIKVYASLQDGEARYSPAEVAATEWS